MTFSGSFSFVHKQSKLSTDQREPFSFFKFTLVQKKSFGSKIRQNKFYRSLLRSISLHSYAKFLSLPCKFSRIVIFKFAFKQISVNIQRSAHEHSPYLILEHIVLFILKKKVHKNENMEENSIFFSPFVDSIFDTNVFQTELKKQRIEKTLSKNFSWKTAKLQFIENHR